MVAKWILVFLLLLGGILRLADASRAPVELIEKDEFIPAAMTITSEHLPLRATQHGIVPLYIIRASGLVFGNSSLGFRLASVIAGTATILLLYLVAARWWGHWAGLTAAALLAVERYHVTISARAVDLPFDLFFVALAIYTFSRFLYAINQRVEPAEAGRWLYGTAIACALGFLCKELTALMAPVLLLSIVLVGQSAWLRRRQTWLAVSLFALIISPDIYSNFAISDDKRIEIRDAYIKSSERLGNKVVIDAYRDNGLYMSYSDHLSRFKGFGFNITPLQFYFGSLGDYLGIKRSNEFGEAPFMNPWLAGILWIGVLLNVLHRSKDNLTIMLLTMFTVVLLVLTSAQLGPARDQLPTDGFMLWYWADRTMLPALLLTGHALSMLVRRRFSRFSQPRGHLELTSASSARPRKT